MREYRLFNNQITFDNAADRFIDLHLLHNSAYFESNGRFDAWYRECKNIETVLSNYPEIVNELIGSLAFQPLFSLLPSYEIYDISQETYLEHCFVSSKSEAALNSIERQYNNIEKEKQEEVNYRTARKNARGRWQGGGFGLGGALKGAATAGALNTVSGLGHSIVNAAGNATSSIAAASQKKKLYEAPQTEQALFQGICLDLESFFQEHLTLIEKMKPDTICSYFDEDRSAALFENAKRIPEKQEELLTQAFALCPWNVDLIKYIFINFPHERKEMCSAADRCEIDLSGCIEDILARKYDHKARESEKNAQDAKKRILGLMKEYGVTQSKTLDSLELDCLTRLCKGYEKMDEDSCKQLVQKLSAYDANEKLKEPFFQQLYIRLNEWEVHRLTEICQGYENAEEKECSRILEAINTCEASRENKNIFQQKVLDRLDQLEILRLTDICHGYEDADEATCEQLKEAVSSFEASDKNKAAFLKRLQTRIEVIWAAEDGEICDNLYMKTDLRDSAAIAETLAYMQKADRTASSDKYVAALNACTPKNIDNAIIYYNGMFPQAFRWTAIILFIGSLLTSIIYKPVSVGMFLCAIIFAIWAYRLKSNWKKLTINGGSINPSFSSSMPTVLQRNVFMKIILAIVLSIVIAVVVPFDNTREASITDSDSVSTSAVNTSTTSASNSSNTETVSPQIESTKDENDLYQEETDVFIPNLNVEERGFDNYVGTWETENQDIRFTIGATSDGYTLETKIPSWDHTSSIAILEELEEDSLCFLGWYEYDDIRGWVRLYPTTSPGILLTSYSFERDYADPSKAMLSAEKLQSQIIERQEVNTDIDLSRSLGWWVPAYTNSYTSYKIVELEDGSYGLRFYVRWFSTTRGDYVEHVSEIHQLIVNENLVTAEIVEESGLYGTIQFSVDRFGTLYLIAAHIYYNDGAESMIDDENAILEFDESYPEPNLIAPNNWYYRLGSVYLTTEMLENYSDNSYERRKAALALYYEIFSRHGYIFESDWEYVENTRLWAWKWADSEWGENQYKDGAMNIQRELTDSDWYTPNTSYSDDLLNEVEQANLAVLLDYLKAQTDSTMDVY